MRKSMIQKTMASAMTAALLVTVLTGCGNGGGGGNTSFEKNGKGSTLEVSLNHSYSSEQLKFDDIPHINGIMPVNDKFLISGNDENYENQLYRLYNPADGSTAEVDLSYPETLPKDGYAYMAGGFANSQGGFTVLHRAYVDSQDENGEYKYEDLGLIIANYDDSMKLKDSKKIEGSENFNFNNIITKPDGGYYANSWDENGNSVFSILDDSFKEVGKVKGDFQYINSIFPDKNNNIYVTYQDMEWNSKFGKLNTESNQLEEITVEGLPQWYNNCIPSTTDDYTLYVSDSNSVYGINLTNGTCEEVVNWVNSDFMGDYVSNINQLPDGRFIIISNDMEYTQSEVWILSPRDPEELKNIKLISMATLYLPSTLSEAVNKFNRSNGEYRIAVVDYQKYNTDDNYEAGLEKLKSDMTAGIVADLICTSSIPYESFCNKGIFTDLTDKASSMDSNDYFTNVFDSLKYGDKLYQMGFSFQINTIEAKTELVGDKSGLSIEEFTKLVTEMPEGMTAFGGEMSKDSALYALITSNLSAFTDVKNGTCNFNTPEFIQLLELCNTYSSEEKDYSNMSDSDWEKYWAEENYQYINNKVLFRRSYISNLRDAYRERFTYFDDAPITMIGYPTAKENSNGGRINIDFTLAISAGSAYKEQCWNFFETMLSDEYQESLRWYFPVKKSAFDKQAEEAMKPEEVPEDGDGVAVMKDGQVLSSTIWRGEEEVEIPAMPQSYVDEIKAYISNTSESGYYDEKIYEIVDEEAQMFFSGDQTAQQAAEMIQSRASLYLSEQS